MLSKLFSSTITLPTSSMTGEHKDQPAVVLATKRKPRPKPRRNNPTRRRHNTAVDILKGATSDFLNTRISLGQLARGTWDVVRGIGTHVAAFNTEKKMFDTLTLNANITYNGVIYNLSNIAQGDDYNQRTGISIRPVGSRLCYSVSINQSNTTHSCRVMLLGDMDNNGVDPTAATILENVGNPYSTISAMNHYGGSRFKVFFDKTVIVDPYHPLYQECAVEVFKDWHVLYQGTAGADTSDWEGALLLFVVSNDSTSGPTFSLHNRLFYVDN